MEGVKANGSILLSYEYVKPGEEKPIRKMGYAVAVPGFDMYLGTGAYLDDLDAKMKPIAWLLGARHSRHRRDFGQHRLDDRPQHLASRSASSATACRRWPTASSTAKFPASAAATKSARWRRPSRSSRTMRCGSAGSNRPRPQTQAARRGRTPRRDGEHRQRFRTQRQRHRPFGVDRRRRHADHGAIDDGDRQRRQRARRDRRRRVGKLVEQCRHGCRRGRRAFQLGRRDFPPGGALQRDRQQGGRRCRTHQRHRRRAFDRRREDRRSRQADPLDRRADQSAGAQRHHRSGARRRIRPRLCGRRFRSEGAGQPDREGDRGNLGAGRGDAGLHQRSGRPRSAASPKPSRR